MSPERKWPALPPEELQTRVVKFMHEVRVRQRIQTYAVLVMLVVVGVLGYYTLHQSKLNHDALCAYRDSVQAQVDSSVKFLSDHPNGLDGITPDIIQASIVQFTTTIAALDSSGLNC